MVQRNHPHKLAVHHLNGGGLQFHLGAQRRAFAQFFLCQLQGQRLVHDRDLGDVDGLHLAVKCFDLRLAQLVTVGFPLEENRADDQHHGDDDLNRVRNVKIAALIGQCHTAAVEQIVGFGIDMGREFSHG